MRNDTGAVLRALGADHVIDTRSEDFVAAGEVYDVVVDTVGGAVLDAAFGVVRPGGRLITLSGPPPAERAAAVGSTQSSLSSLPTGPNSPNSPALSMPDGCK